MTRIPFKKVTSCGNNFILIDERENRLIHEAYKSEFARQVTNPCFGIGADGCILVQPAAPAVLDHINTHRGYWQETPVENADYLFRMFEPNGTESFCCGNGLMCIAHHLQRTTAQTSFSILTEIPGPVPMIRTVGVNEKKKTAWADMGTPRTVPGRLACLDHTIALDAGISQVDFHIPIRDLPWNDSLSIGQGLVSLTGYLVFSGEPHLIFMFPPHEKKCAHTVADTLYRQSSGILNKSHPLDTGSLVPDPFHALGHYFNTRARQWFPRGINVNLITWHDNTQTLEHRCFERGIEKETLACGTGIVASVHLICTLKKIPADIVEVHPLRCRIHRPGATLWVTVDQGRYRLEGAPEEICTGFFTPATSRNGTWPACHPENMVVNI